MYWEELTELMNRPCSAETAHWIEAEENPFHVRLFDCRYHAYNAISTTTDVSIALSWQERRGSFGEQHKGQKLENPLRTECNLKYPASADAKDFAGPLFLSQDMNEKWDIFVFDACLYCARSWTDQLIFIGGLEFSANEVLLTFVEADLSSVEGSPDLALQQLDYLIKSHALEVPVPHPLPNDLPDEPERITRYSYEQFGRRGVFATFADTAKIIIPWQ